MHLATVVESSVIGDDLVTVTKILILLTSTGSRQNLGGLVWVVDIEKWASRKRGAP